MTRHRAVASMAIATIISRIIGFLRIIVIAALLGTTALGNTFQSTNAISNILFDLLAAGALSAAIVPPLSKALKNNNDDFRRLIKSLSTLVIILLGAVAIVGVIFAPVISKIIFHNAPIATRLQQIQTGTVLLRFFIPQVVLYGLGAVAVAGLTAKKKFIAQAIAPIGGSIFIMVAIAYFRFVHPDLSMNLTFNDKVLLGIAGTGACIAFVAIPIITAFRNGMSLFPSRDISSGASVIKMSLWAVAIQAAAAIILAIVLFIGNNIDGAIVAYQLAFVFFLAPYAIFSQSFSTVLLPDLSVDSSDKNKFGDLVKYMFVWTYRPMLVATSIAIALSVPLTWFVTQGKATSGHSMVLVAFISLVLGIVPYSVYQGASRVFFAQNNVRLPALAILISTTIVSIFAIILSNIVNGYSIVVVMGLTHTLSYLFASIVLVYILHRRGYRVLPDKITWLILLASMLYASFGYFLSVILNIDNRFESIVFSFAFIATSCVIVGLVGGKRLLSSVKTVIKQLRKQKANNIDTVLDVHDIELSP